LMEPGGEVPPMPAPAFGDSISALALASGVAAALAGRTERGRDLDASLLGVGIWVNAGPIIGCDRTKDVALSSGLVGTYLTEDDRTLALLDGAWSQFDLLEQLDATWRSADDLTREDVANLIGSKPFAAWVPTVLRRPGPIVPVNNALEVVDDVQFQSNNYVAHVEGSRESHQLIANPIRFNESPVVAEPAPASAEHTFAVLSEFGYSDEQIIDFVLEGVVA
jgi:crotonobetainyl-CoA:carnitine CoA-transferase CaiB-like acyl-CoA transferase